MKRNMDVDKGAIAESGKEISPEVGRRLKALNKLQLKTKQLQEKYLEDIQQLRCMYNNHRYTEQFSKRADIVKGVIDPNAEDCNWPDECSSPPDDDQVLPVTRANLSVITRELEARAVGVPWFWLTCLKKFPPTTSLVHPHDEPPLSFLDDIKVTFDESQSSSLRFTLNFHFSENPYFRNSVLTKEYDMTLKEAGGSSGPLGGAQPGKAIGCSIHWNEGMDVSERKVRCRQRNQTTVRTVVKTVRKESFFNFFRQAVTDRTSASRDQDSPGDSHQQLMMDLMTGSLICWELVPKAVLFFTEEAFSTRSSKFPKRKKK